MFETLEPPRPSNILFLALIILAAVPAYGAEPKLGYSKVLVGNRYLTAQPNASAAPAIALLTDLDATIIETYEESTLSYVNPIAMDTLRDRALEYGVEITPRDDYDKIFVNGRLIDTRLGTRTSLPGETFDPPYQNDEWGAWLIQFAGPIRPAWLAEIRAVGIIPVQYLPYNAFIAGGRESAVRNASALRYIQYVEQMHRFMKPTFSIPEGEMRELWIQVITTNETSSTIAFLQRLSRREIAVAAWNEVETRVEGVFTSADLAMIAGDPLVIAAVERPTIALSDERATLSVTSLTPGTTPGKYKKWLGDLCESCGNLSADGYYIGFADVGLDGGSHAATAQISGEPDASGLHRADMPPSRIVYGSSFEDPAGEWAPAAEITPDSTGTKHDVRGHGTLVAAVAAGDPGTSGLTDGEGFLWGLGVAPTAGMLITKINPRKIAIFATPVDGVTADARSHPTQIAYVQNHSYNQYNGAQRQNCDKYYDGYYSILSRDFDAELGTLMPI